MVEERSNQTCNSDEQSKDEEMRKDEIEKSSNEALYDKYNAAVNRSLAYTRTTLPKQILKNGTFLQNVEELMPSKSKQQHQILWEPSCDNDNKSNSDSSPINLWNTIWGYFQVKNDKKEADKNNNGYEATGDDDVESQNIHSKNGQVDQEDGIYVPPHHSSSTRDRTREYSHRERIRSRLERDQINCTKELDDTSIDSLDHNNDYIFKRPQDILPEHRVDQTQPMNHDNDSIEKNVVLDENDTTSTTLVVEIVRTKLHDHPNFLEEERLVEHIDKLYKKMLSLNCTEKMCNFEVRLHAIISATFQLDEMQNKHKLSENRDNSQYSLLYEDFLQVISKIAEMEFNVHSLYCSILKKWERVMKLRKVQGFQCTSYRLVKIEHTNHSNCDESIMKVMNRFRQHFERLSSSAKSELDYTSQNIQDAIETFYIVQTTRRQRFDIALEKGNVSMISNASKNTSERKRRNSIRSECYNVKLLVDDELIGTTHNVKTQWPSMQLTFGKKFEIALQGKSPQVCMQIYQVRMGLMDKLISKIYLSFPGQSSLMSEKNSLEYYAPVDEWYHFSNSSSLNNSESRIEGSILVKTYWRRVKLFSVSSDYDRAGNLIKPDLISNPNRKIFIGCRQSRSQRMIQEKNQISSRSQMKSSVLAALNESSLRFRHQGTRHSFHNSRLFREPMRHRLMKQRHYNKFLPNDFRIPLEEKYISLEDNHRVASFDQISQRNNETFDKACKEHTLADPINVRELINQLESITKCSMYWGASNKCGFEDIVHDISRIRDQAPRPDLNKFFNILNPPRIRTLFPNNISTTDPTNNDSGASVFITVISARNVQQREDPLTIDHGPFLMSPPTIRRLTVETPFATSLESFRLNRGEDYDKSKKKNFTRPFVRIKFQDNVFYTKVGAGDCPIWEQRFEIPLLANSNDGSCVPPSLLKTIDDDIEITLFDKVDIDYGQGGGFYDDENTLVQDRKFLGCVKFPLEKLCEERRVHGHQLLQTSDILLGYESEKLEVPFTNTKNQIENEDADDRESQKKDFNTTRRSIPTTLNLLLTMGRNVAFTPNQALNADAPSNEPPSVVSYAQDWMNGIFNTFDTPIYKQLYDILVPGSNGKTWLVNRFLCSQAPPRSCQSSLHKCAHFVSLLPRLDHWSSFKSLNYAKGLCFSSQKFLDILAGNWFEHALLLANYFICLSDEGPESAKMEIYVVIGSTVSESKVVYVMTKTLTDGMKRFWDPVNGMSYATGDSNSPLTNIGLLFTTNNIYANLKPSIHPCLLDFMIHDKRKWKPFHNQYSQPESLLNPVQDHILQYSDPKFLLAKELEIDILDKVKISIRSWRRTSCTFNTDAGNRLCHILDELEDHKRNGTFPTSDYRSSLNSICYSRGKSVFGFPLHFSFMNVEEILGKIEMTCIHESKHPEGEFAAAVKVFPYECGVMSVWVFVCNIAPDHMVP